MDDIDITSLYAAHPWDSETSGDVKVASEDEWPPFVGLLGLIEQHGRLGFWCHDVATDRITVSRGLACITGTPVTVTRTRDSMLRIIHPQDRRKQADQRPLADAGQPLQREFRIVRPDGTIRWVSSRVEVILGDDGRAIRFVGLMVDITDRRQVERAYDFDQERHAALLKALSASSWTADPQGRCIDFSMWCGLTGMEQEACEGVGWLQAIHPDDRERAHDAFVACLEQGTLLKEDYRVLTRDGGYRWFSTRGAPVRDARGTIQEWQGALVPIEGDPRLAAAPAGSGDLPPLSGSQIRGARGLLDWSLAQLAVASGVSVSTIKRLEDGSEGVTRASKSGAVRRALEDGGVTFRTIDGFVWLTK